MDQETRILVRIRAQYRCEYCGLPQSALPFTSFHVEHIRPKKHDGSDDPSNLALACGHCNRHKGPNLAGIDPKTNEMASLFNPREHNRDDHFALKGILINGLTPIGRATVRVLNMNSWIQLRIRDDLKS